MSAEDADFNGLVDLYCCSLLLIFFLLTLDIVLKTSIAVISGKTITCANNSQPPPVEVPLPLAIAPTTHHCTARLSHMQETRLFP